MRQSMPERADEGQDVSGGWDQALMPAEAAPSSSAAGPRRVSFRVVSQEEARALLHRPANDEDEDSDDDSPRAAERRAHRNSFTLRERARQEESAGTLALKMPPVEMRSEGLSRSQLEAVVAVKVEAATVRRASLSLAIGESRSRQGSFLLTASGSGSSRSRQGSFLLPTSGSGSSRSRQGSFLHAAAADPAAHSVASVTGSVAHSAAHSAAVSATPSQAATPQPAMSRSESFQHLLSHEDAVSGDGLGDAAAAGEGAGESEEENAALVPAAAPPLHGPRLFKQLSSSSPATRTRHLDGASNSSSEEDEFRGAGPDDYAPAGAHQKRGGGFADARPLSTLAEGLTPTASVSAADGAALAAYAAEAVAAAAAAGGSPREAEAEEQPSASSPLLRAGARASSAGGAGRAPAPAAQKEDSGSHSSSPAPKTPVRRAASAPASRPSGGADSPPRQQSPRQARGGSGGRRPHSHHVRTLQEIAEAACHAAMTAAAMAPVRDWREVAGVGPGNRPWRLDESKDQVFFSWMKERERQMRHEWNFKHSKARSRRGRAGGRGPCVVREEPGFHLRTNPPPPSLPPTTPLPPRAA